MSEKPYAITLDPASSLINHTGAWRTKRPQYVHRLPPCNHACPAGEASQAWLALAEEGRFEDAWRKIVEDNPFPAVMGRVCYHPCQSACNRGEMDDPVGINSVERFIGDLAIRERWNVEPGADTGKRVMIVGAGPAGLSAAWHLRRMGHGVVIFDANERPGGLIRYAIPHFRMPRESLAAEIARIEAMGAEIRCNHYVEDILDARERGNFDAVFVAPGTPLSRQLKLPQEGDMPVRNALEILRDHEEGRPLDLYGRVAVYGAGNTAMDIARTAVRIGASNVSVIARRAQEHLAAHPQEIKEALDEGAELILLRSIDRIGEKKLVLERLSATNERRPRPLGEYEEFAADVLVLAVGQTVESQLLEGIDGLELDRDFIKVDANMQCSIDGVYAGGDVTGPGTATSAIGQGKRAARAIDAWLNGGVYTAPERAELASFEHIEPWYYSDAPRTHRPRLDEVRRTSGFAEVVGNLDEETATFEARRCLSCGNCFECDNCYGVCPDNAIRKLGEGQGFEFRYDYCKGCGLCESECPCGAIEMVNESN